MWGNVFRISAFSGGDIFFAQLVLISKTDAISVSCLLNLNTLCSLVSVVNFEHVNVG